MRGYSPFSQIDQSKHREGSIGVLSKTAIVHLGETPEMLERHERMLTPIRHGSVARTRTRMD